MRLVVTLLLCLVCLGRAQAHRLDEYLQATRIGVEPDRVDVEIDLTPGVSVASPVLWLIDSNGDGQITEKEIRAYAGRVLAAVGLELDGRSRPLRLTDVTVPSRDEIVAGEGMIRLKAATSIPPLKRGPHQIRFQNAHEPGLSVYLVNALFPSNPGIRITKQTRDDLQRNYQMDFEVTGGFPGGGSPLLPGYLAGALLLGAVLWQMRPSGPNRRRHGLPDERH